MIAEPGHGRLRRALVFAGGRFSTQVLDGVAKPCDFAAVVCVDSGLVHCLKAGFQPTLLLGDMDSVPPDALSDDALTNIPRHLYPADKNASDLELALDTLASADSADVTGPGQLELQRPEQVVVVGVSGGRTDHMLFNWMLAGLRDWPFELRLLDTTTDAILVTPTRPLSTSIGEEVTVSLLPLRRVEGVCTEGLRYALVDDALDVGSTRGLSNVTDGGHMRVSIRAGRLLVLTTR